MKVQPIKIGEEIYFVSDEKPTNNIYYNELDHSVRKGKCENHSYHKKIIATNFSKLVKALIPPTYVFGEDEVEIEMETYCPHPLDTYKCGMEVGCDEDGCYSGKTKPKLNDNNEVIIGVEIIDEVISEMEIQDDETRREMYFVFMTGYNALIGKDVILKEEVECLLANKRKP